MEQQTGNQYDDDLTIDTEEYDDSYYSGSENLFDYVADEDLPITRLKSLVLSIDWEITDDILLEFNEELIGLKEYWADSRINLIYLQALEKISKYIYTKKADAHPSAIKLLLTLYQNLEKIVLETSWSDEQKKELLYEDVRRFEQLKAHIKNEAMKESNGSARDRGGNEDRKRTAKKQLLKLKSIVLGIDWEITDEDLSGLRHEVQRLDGELGQSRPKKILLQGIGSLGAYIDQKKSNAHPEAFKVLHIFYSALEAMVVGNLSLEEEKEILFPAVTKFNAFKTVLEEAAASAKSDQTKVDGGEDSGTAPEYQNEDDEDGEIRPAFADIPEDEIHGFQAQEEAESLGFASPDDVVSHVGTFFADEDLQEDMLPETAGKEGAVLPEGDAGLERGFDVPRDVALQGVDVESDADDELDEPALPELDGDYAPALCDEEGDVTSDWAFADDSSGEEVSGDEVDGTVERFFSDEGEKQQNAPDEDGVGPDNAIVFTLVDQDVDYRSELRLGVGEMVQNQSSAEVARINSVIERLEKIWSESAVEKTFLELHTVLLDHIKKFQANADPDVFELLQSVNMSLDSAALVSVQKKHELLYSSIKNVLKWQQKFVEERVL
ncbi:hypothetical protein [Desulforhopalus singaporensis]|uniref:hypothetical protein n=1 Tax=Desulforhopalus singaporensis TaxID=91360 RepID=UPI00115FE5C6|nr:hypothetical protein [Desulforhopalus singaporensis]